MARAVSDQQWLVLMRLYSVERLSASDEALLDVYLGDGDTAYDVTEARRALKRSLRALEQRGLVDVWLEDVEREGPYTSYTHELTHCDITPLGRDLVVEWADTYDDDIEPAKFLRDDWLEFTGRRR